MRKSIVLLLLLLTACLPPAGVSAPRSDSPWAEALRALDPADAQNPANDITAVYLRQEDGNLQVRIDLLDYKNQKDLSLDIQIGSESAPEAKPLTIYIPSKSDSARVTLDPQLANVTVEIPISEIPTNPRVDVSTPEDQITGLTLDGPVPTQTAPLLLTFYGTFAARFPAEALRSWDGAHTGPRGERHGLKHLLDAVEKYGVPVILLDLKTPENLSALDAMGVLPRIQTLAERGLLILPETASIDSGVAQFGIVPSPLLYDPNPVPWSKFVHRFVFTDDYFHLYHWFRFPTENIIYIPVATETDSNQLTRDGPSLEVRRALLETALNDDQKDLLVLGGSFPNTTWGSPDMVDQTLAYIASRPYIKVLREADLLKFPTISGRPNLLQKQADTALVKMKNNYARFNGRVMDYAENWNEHLPEQTQIRCDLDIDWDDQDECVLANQDFLALLDPQGARLTYFFAHNKTGLHQLVGPSWQVAVGLSDPSTWQSDLGEAADPGAYPGAFADIGNPFLLFTPKIEGDHLVFTSTDGTLAKIFQLTDSGIQTEYQSQTSVTAQIPLMVDPDSRFIPGWAERYTQQNAPGEITWGLQNGPMVKIQFAGEMTFHAFNESLSLLNSPEDPNFEYPPGHYLPFPMAVVEIKMDGSASTVQLIVLP